jgi:hypothetical protein
MAVPTTRSLRGAHKVFAMIDIDIFEVAPRLTVTVTFCGEVLEYGVFEYRFDVGVLPDIFRPLSLVRRMSPDTHFCLDIRIGGMSARPANQTLSRKSRRR